MFPELAALLFASRDYAHRAHLQTSSYSAHKALESFYDEMAELVDATVEMYQGRNGIIHIPLCDLPTETDPVTVLSSHLQIIESLRDQAAPNDRPVQNKLDEVCGLFLRTLYKLKNLK